VAPEAGYEQRLENAVRALATASRAIRLYPAASPLRAQAAEAASAALEVLFRDGLPVVSLTVARDGFTTCGEPVGSTTSGVGELVDELRSHGVAELSITPGCNTDELLGFLTVLGAEPAVVRMQGGISATLAGNGVECIRATDVQLTVVEHVGPAPDEDIDEFLRSLAQDPEKLAAWFAVAALGDPRAFEESLMELVRVSGPSGYSGMLAALATAFCAQRAEAKDALLGLAMDTGPTRDLVGEMFGLLTSSDIATSVLEGALGKNMLLLSTALTRLPLDQVTAEVRAEVQAMLPSTGHTTKEAEFLDHMITVRERLEPETPLVDADDTYRTVSAAVALSDEAIAQARGAVESSQEHATAAGVGTLLLLLDQQSDFALYVRCLDTLAAVVPALIERGDLDLAARVLSELSRRQTADIGPWPELSGRLREALSAAAGTRSMGALLDAVLDDPTLVPVARDIVRLSGDGAADALVGAAIDRKGPGLSAAEELLGRRFIDTLSHQALQAQWFQLAPVSARLAKDGDPRAAQALDTLMRRPDDQSRREVATGLAEADGPLASRLLGQALADKSAEVVIVAARAAGRAGRVDVAPVIAARIGQLDIDNTDFLVGRELIAALARIPDPISDTTLAKLAGRRALLRRGRFAEVQDLVGQARAYRAQAQAGGVR
jgi:hypothetical protein